jgi:hypothetical protein
MEGGRCAESTASSSTPVVVAAAAEPVDDGDRQT